MVKTKSIFDPVEESDGRRILVALTGKDKTKFDEWLTSLAPTYALLYGYKDGKITWEEYVSEYKRLMKREKCQENIRRLAELSKKQDITLLCWEQEGNPHCHRHLLKEMIDSSPLL